MVSSRSLYLTFVVAGGLLASRLPADVIYSGEMNLVLSRTDYRVDSPSVYPNASALNIDLSGDGQLDFSFFSHAPIPGVPSFVLFGARGLNDGYYSGSGSSLLKTYAAGELIGSGPQWTSDSGGSPAFDHENWWAPHFFGSLSGEGYLGFKVQNGDMFNFGWISYSILPGFGSPLSITSWAFETDAGVAIAAGDKGGEPVPENSSVFVCGLAALALGVARRFGK